MNYYILLKNKTAIIQCKKVLESYEVPYEIVPSPRQLSVSCTESIKIAEEHLKMVESILRAHSEIATAGIHGIEKKKRFW